MSNEENIIEILQDPLKWPSIDRPEFSGKLDEIADDAFSNPDERSCIASVLIYQQLVEELLKVLLQSCNFLVQARLLPIEIKFSDSDNKMFGRLIEDFKRTIVVPNKEKIIEIANRINYHRIKIAHGLTKRESLKDLLKSAQEVRDLFEKFFKYYDDAYDWTRVCLNSLRKSKID